MDFSTRSCYNQENDHSTTSLKNVTDAKKIIIINYFYFFDYGGGLMQSTTTVHWNKGTISKEHNERDEELCKNEPHIDLYNQYGDSFHETILRRDLQELYE